LFFGSFLVFSFFIQFLFSLAMQTTTKAEIANRIELSSSTMSATNR